MCIAHFSILTFTNKTPEHFMTLEELGRAVYKTTALTLAPSIPPPRVSSKLCQQRLYIYLLAEQIRSVVASIYI